MRNIIMRDCIINALYQARILSINILSKNIKYDWIVGGGEESIHVQCATTKKKKSARINSIRNVPGVARALQELQRISNIKLKMSIKYAACCVSTSGMSKKSQECLALG